jgi:DnaK suppressor protein
MDEVRARSLLAAERAEVEQLLRTVGVAQQQEFVAEQETGDFADRAEPLTAEGVDDAVLSELRDRLNGIARAEQRLSEGRFGRSVRSGSPIPDGRLEADPTVELTVEEAESS